MSDREVSETRAQALLKEAGITAAERRSACVVLAGRALAAADGDRQAAKAVLIEALEAIGEWPYTPARRGKPPRGCVTATVNYERPGGSS